LDELAVIRSGFRAKYIIDAAKKVDSGEIDLGLVYDMDIGGGANYLKRINGVGDKVAACVLLFAYNKLGAFPVDVWIKKVLGKYYPAGFDYTKAFGEYAGVANAYLFYYERENNQIKQ
jgi:N-glycosylase/DNA lyase